MQETSTRKSVFRTLFCAPQTVFESVAYWLLAVMIWAPIIQSPAYLPYIFSGSDKVMYYVTYVIGYSFYAMAVLCIFYSVWRVISWGLALRRGELRLPSVKALLQAHLFAVLTCVFLLLAFVSTILSTDVWTGFFGHKQRTDGFLTYAGFCAIMLTAAQVRDRKKRASLLKNTVIVIALCALLMFCQVFSLQPVSRWFNMTGAAFFRNSNHFGYILAICAMICSGAMFAAKEKKTRIHATVLLVFFLTALLYNNTLGANLGVACAFVLMGFLYKPALGTGRLHSFLPLAIYALVTALTALIPEGRFACSFVEENIASTLADLRNIANGEVSGNVETTQGTSRLLLWKFTLQLIAQKPLLGWGGDQTRWEFIRNGFDWAASPHNEYLNLASFFGIPAAVCLYAGEIWLLARRLRGVRTLSRTTLIALGAAFAYAVSAFFGVSQLHSASYFYLMMGLVASGETAAATPEETQQPSD